MRFLFVGPSALPAASFRSHLAVGTLAVRLTLPPVGCVEDLHLHFVRYLLLSEIIRYVCEQSVIERS